MANASIPGLPVATSLDGTEQLEIVQPPGATDGVTKRATTGQIAALAATGGSPPAASFILATQNTGLANSRVLAVDTADIAYTDTGALGTATIGPINTAAISYAKFQQVGALSVIGQSSNATGVIDAIPGTTDQVLRVGPSGTTLGFGQVNLSSTSAVTGFLATSYITGIFTTSTFTGIWPVPFGGTGTGTLTANGVLVGNGTSSVQIATANTAGYVLTDNGTAAVPTFQPPGGLSQQAGLSVLGVSTTATATPSAITGTTDQVLRVSPNGTALLFGQVNLSATSAVTGFLATSYITGTFASSSFTGIVSVRFGGTGTSSLTANGIITGNGTSTVNFIAAGSAGQVLIAQTTTSDPAFKTVAGDFTITAAGTATIASNAVTFAKFQTMTGLSVMGVAGTATANASTITGTTNQALVVNPGGTGIIFGQLNLSSTSAVTGTLANAQLATMAPNTIKGNNTASTATPSDLTVANVQALLGVAFPTVSVQTVDFNSGATDTQYPITLPTGYTRYLVSSLRVTGASAALTTATVGLFTAAGGGGTAIVSSGTAVTVNTASENANNNSQGFTIANAGTQSYTASPLYFRVVNANGTSGTGKVTLVIQPTS